MMLIFMQSYVWERKKNNKRCEAKEHKTPSDYLTVTFAYMPFIWRAKI